MKHLLLTTIAAVLFVGCGNKASHPAKPANPEANKAPGIPMPTLTVMGDIEAVKKHLAAGTDVNAVITDGWTSLHEAAHYGNKEIAELLIKAGANVKLSGGVWVGKTPLDLAKGEIADLLREHGGKTAAELKAGKNKQ